MPPIIAAAAACGADSGAHAFVTSPYPDTAALARDLPGLLRVSGVPGLSMAVVQKGRVVWTGAFGTVNDDAKTPLDTATVFEAASLSKPVFAYLVLRLADRGELELDRRCSKCSSTRGSRTTSATGGSLPAWCSPTPE